MGIYAFLRENNFNFEPTFDGLVHRFKPNGRKDKSGWFIGHTVVDSKFKSDIKILIVGDWSTGEKLTWHSKKRFNEYEKEIVDKEIHLMERKRQEEQKLSNEKAIKKVNYYLSNKLDQALDFKYLKDKKIDDLKSAKLCEDDGTTFITVPLFDINNKLWSCQRIFEDGSKKFISGGKIKECFHIISDNVENKNDTYFCEGWATGMTIYKATKATVVCTMNTSNMINVAEAFKDVESNFYVCADNDEKTNERIGKNPGIEAATKAASILGARLFYPSFRVAKSGTDFNDLECLEGLDEVQAQLDLLLIKDRDERRYFWKWNGFFELKETKKGNVETPDYQCLGVYYKDEYYLKASESYSYIYDDGYYKFIGKKELKQKINEDTKYKCTNNLLNNFYEMSQVICFHQEDAFKPEKGYLNLNNGILDVKNKKLIDHHPKYFFKYKLDHDYVPDAKCDNWLKFLFQIFDGNKDLIELSQMIFGYTLIGGYPWLHKAFVLYGSGRNGKSVYLSTLKHMIGSNNYSSVPIDKLNLPFSAVLLDGRIANITGEVTTNIINSDSFKTAVGGEELIVSHKNQGEYMLPVESRFFFAANKMPNFKDSTIGAFEKLCIIPFNRYIKPEDRIDSYESKFLYPEMSGIINWALEGLDKTK